MGQKGQKGQKEEGIVRPRSHTQPPAAHAQPYTALRSHTQPCTAYTALRSRTQPCATLRIPTQHYAALRSPAQPHATLPSPAQLYATPPRTPHAANTALDSLRRYTQPCPTMPYQAEGHKIR